MVRVRFAPSPTGYLHVGGARTALFNWLFARRNGGTFVLRIEDTDAERSSWEMVAGIVDGMRWLGLDWDEGPDIGGPHAPYFQSQRLEKYRAMAAQLVAGGHAYLCFCTPETIQAKRAAAGTSGTGWKYDRSCCGLAADEASRLEAASTPRAIRFKVPPGRTTFHDRVHGPIAFDNENIEDFVVLRSDGQPTYHLSVVVDDIDMEITHVVRGDDHISNTPKHVLLYQAFERPTPQFAHVPLILGPDKKRLSKRHGATSVMEYPKLGYIPEAMVNFLALLGWSPGNDRELLTREELIGQFALDGISGGNAVFNPEKLDWFNQQHLMRMSADQLAERLEPLMNERGVWRDSYRTTEREWFLKVIELLKPRVRRLPQFIEEGAFFFTDVEFEEAAVWKHLGVAGTSERLEALREALGASAAFRAPELETRLRSLAEALGIKAGILIHATRVAVTGRANSPGLFEVLELLGRDRTIDRLTRAIPMSAA